MRLQIDTYEFNPSSYVKLKQACEGGLTTQQNLQQQTAILSPPHSTSKMIKDEVDVTQQQQPQASGLNESLYASRRSTRVDSSNARIQTPTSLIDWCDYWRHLCSSYTRVQLFRLKGAQRKLKTDRNKIEKNPPDMRKRYQLSTKVTSAYNCAFDPLYSLLPFVRHDFNVQSGSESAKSNNCLLVLSSEATTCMAGQLSGSSSNTAILNGNSSLPSSLSYAPNRFIDCLDGNCSGASSTESISTSNGFHLSDTTDSSSIAGSSNGMKYASDNVNSNSTGLLYSHQQSSILVESGISSTTQHQHIASDNRSINEEEQQQRYQNFYLDSNYPSSPNQSMNPIYSASANAVAACNMNGLKSAFVTGNEVNVYQAESTTNILLFRYNLN
ncbi:MAG: hypothetical protein ACRC1W_14020, partial [Shewanella sp.]